jgi:transcription elongation factor GreA
MPPARLTTPPARLTAQGIARLQDELARLKQVRRLEVAERIRRARDEAHGDSADSAGYHEAKNELALIERRITDLERLLSHVEVLAETSQPHSEVALGTQVEACDGDGEREIYVIVDAAEAAPRLGRISHISPVGRALLGRRPGDEVGVETPNGVRYLTILAVS